MNKKKYKVVSIFTGAMGLDLGLLKTNRFEVVACVEKEEIFCETILSNINKGNIPEKPKVYKTDIKKIDPQIILKDLNISKHEIDVLIGGPPCQSFSTAGRRGTTQDPRGTLLWDFMRFVKILKPKIFLMENVRGLMSAALKHRPIAERPNKGGPPLESEEEPGSVVKLFAHDLQNFTESPYHMDCYEVNAVNYGAPQLRERVLFLGNRFNKEIDFPNPTHGRNNIKKQMSLFDNTNEIEPIPWKTLGDAIKDLKEDNPVIMDFSPRKKHFLSLVPPGGNWRYLPEDIQKESMGKAFFAKGGRSGWWRRLSFDLPCPTLVTMPNHARTSLCHPLEARALTVREYCRIQEFPDDWIVCGKPSQKYAQIGNAVPLKLGEVAGDVIATALDSLANSDWNICSGKPKPYRKVYIQSHVRTRQWYKNGKAYKWEDGKKNDKVSYAPPKTERCFSIMEKGNI